MITGFLLGLGAVYCAGCYYINRGYLTDMRSATITPVKVLATVMFVASPITVPLSFAALIIAH